MTPGRTWRIARRLCQCVAFAAILIAPFLGGWQRLERADMAVWDDSGWNLPGAVRDDLPRGHSAGRAYEALWLAGGGLGAEYAGIPFVDPVAGAAALVPVAGAAALVPVAGAAALVHSELSWRFVLALFLPVLIAAFAGRVFCGWLCPYGVIARGLDAIMRRMPWPKRRLVVPARRPVRWLLLAAILVAGGSGGQLAVLVFLPHLLVQQSVYSMWLLGGGGAVLGALLGLIAAGLLFGPTVYCAALCPTGAVLGLIGRKKRVHVTLAEPATCGKHCTLCDSACWLSLRPSSGDPGPDCDSCARCFAACPRTNLIVNAGKKPPKTGKRHLPVIAAVLVGAACVVGEPGMARAGEVKPRLLLSGEVSRGDVLVAVALVDHSGEKLDPDWSQALEGVELSVYMTRGQALYYRGPLDVRVGDQVVHFDAPTAPRSTPKRTIYRRMLHPVWPVRPEPGTAVVVDPVPGWLPQPLTWRVPAPGVVRSWTGIGLTALASALVFCGLMGIALVIAPDRGA